MATAYPGTRLPVEPLEQAATATFGSVHAAGRSLARVLGRCRTIGLTVETADRWAVYCGNHPAELWPDLWWAIADRKEVAA